LTLSTKHELPLGIEARKRSPRTGYTNSLQRGQAIEIISEASRRIPDDLKATAPDIPWRDVADIGNFLRHVYERTDPEIVWTVVKFRLAPLEQAIRGMLERLNDQS